MESYDQETHWMLKLAANECARLEHEIEKLNRSNEEYKELFMEYKNKYMNNLDNAKQRDKCYLSLESKCLSLEQQLDNAFQSNNQLKDKIDKYEIEIKELQKLNDSGFIGYNELESRYTDLLTKIAKYESKLKEIIAITDNHNDKNNNKHN